MMSHAIEMFHSIFLSIVPRWKHFGGISFARFALVILITVMFMHTQNTTIATAQEVGRYQDWAVSRKPDTKSVMCYALSVPKKSEGKYTRRGSVYFFASHFDPQAQKFQISVAMGYTIKEGSVVEVTIGSEKFQFSVFSQYPETAFAFAKDEKKIMQAIKKGYTMVVKGESSRSTKTTDTYSLLGASRAFLEASTKC